MEPQNELMLIGRDLHAQAFMSFAAMSRSSVFAPQSPPATAAAPTAPLTTHGTLTPGTLYQSSTGEERVRYYLPVYSVATVDGSYAVRLRRGRSRIPAGAAGYLSVEVAAAGPTPGVQLREVEHQLVGRLQYRVPVVSETAAAAMAVRGPVISDPDGPRAPDGRARRGPTLTIELGAFTPTGRGTRRCELPLASEADVSRVYQALTDPGAEARLALGYFATAAQKSWRQFVLGTSTWSKQELVAARGVQVAPLFPIAPGDPEPPERVFPPGASSTRCGRRPPSCPPPVELRRERAEMRRGRAADRAAMRCRRSRTGSRPRPPSGCVRPAIEPTARAGWARPCATKRSRTVRRT